MRSCGTSSCNQKISKVVWHRAFGLLRLVWLSKISLLCRPTLEICHVGRKQLERDANLQGWPRLLLERTPSSIRPLWFVRADGERSYESSVSWASAAAASAFFPTSSAEDKRHAVTNLMDACSMASCGGSEKSQSSELAKGMQHLKLTCSQLRITDFLKKNTSSVKKDHFKTKGLTKCAQ